MIEKRENGYKILILLSDILAIAAAYALSLLFRFVITKDWSFYKPGEAPIETYIGTFPYVLVLWLVIFRFSGAYSAALKGADEILTVLKAVIFGTLISLSYAFFYRGFEYSRAILVIFALLTPFLVIIFRIIARSFRYKILKSSGSITPLVIVGYNDIGKNLAREISEKQLNYNFLGFITEPEPVSSDTSNRILGNIDNISQLIKDHNIREVWIAIPGGKREKILELVETCLREKISWKMVPDLYEVMLDWVKIDSLAGIPLIGMRRSNITGLNAITKRILDIILSSVIIVIAGPFMLIAAALVKLTSSGPVLFIQKRVGYNGKRFPFLKFRTMETDSSRSIHKDFTKQWIEGTVTQPEGEDKLVYKIKADPRRTPIGKWLRKFSVDELPQLFNVLKGDMSLIGPRPALAYEVEKYKEWHKRRLEAKPGITGLWQVSGRNMLSFEEMVKLDIYYIENWSISLDLKILFKTVFVVISSKAY